MLTQTKHLQDTTACANMLLDLLHQSLLSRLSNFDCSAVTISRLKDLPCVNNKTLIQIDLASAPEYSIDEPCKLPSWKLKKCASCVRGSLHSHMRDSHLSVCEMPSDDSNVRDAAWHLVQPTTSCWKCSSSCAQQRNGCLKQNLPCSCAFSLQAERLYNTVDAVH